MALTSLNPNLLGTDSSGASKMTTAGGLVQLHSTGQFTIANTSANNFYIANTGLIGIGNASPTHTLSVNGTVYLSNTITITGNATFSNTITITGNATFSNTTTFASNDAITLPTGTTAQRPTGVSGMMRFNANTSTPEYYNGSAWISLGTLDGSTASLAAPSASAIYNLGIRTSGLYWLKPASWSYPAQFYCEMSNGGGGWIYLMQRYLVGDQGLPYSWATGASGLPNQANAQSTTSNFYGVYDTSSTAKSIQDIWDGFVGSGSNGKVYAREIFTSGSYDEWQYYVNSSGSGIFSKTNFLKMLYGNFPTSYGGSSPVTGITVYYNNGASTATNQYLCGWGSTGTLGTINNGNIDGASYYCNGEDGVDANWMFGLGKGSTPFPGSASYTGGARGSNNRWGILAIKA